MTEKVQASRSDADFTPNQAEAIITPEQAEEDRRSRVLARLVYAGGALIEYHHPLSAGFVKPLPDSVPSKSVPLISIFDLPRAESGMTDAEVKFLESIGLMSIFEWKREAGFQGKIELALWLPDLGHNREVKKPSKAKTGRPMPAQRSVAKPTGPQFTAYPPQPVAWHNMMSRDSTVPKLFEEDVGHVQVIAIIDCENQNDLKSLYDRYGAPV